MLKLENFDALRLTLASPATVMSWSHGEVTKPETINYRTLRPERDGLFCERIFGPTRDWECHCGKYKRYRYKGIICDKCGVEVTRSKVRRERMGHIKLASPVSHVWYFKGIPSRMGLLLDMSPRNLEKVLYFANYIVTDVDEDARGTLLDRLGTQQEERAAALRAQIDGKAETLRTEFDQQQKALKDEISTEVDRLQREFEQTSDKLTQQGQKLQGTIQQGIGTKAKRDLVVGLDDGEEVVVSKGEVMTEEMVPALLRKVQEKIEQAEATARAAQDGARERGARDDGQLDAQIEVATAEERERIELELEALDEEIRVARESLEALHVKQLLTDAQYREAEDRFDGVFRAGIGAEAIKELLSRVDLDQEYYRLREESKATSGQRKQKAIKRLKVVEDFRKSEGSPTWMIMDVLPVIPPELRPMVQLDGGRFATSDLNDLYRRVINRNNRLKRLLELGAPEIIVRNEKRMLQEAVDALIDNGRRGRAITGTGNRKLKSLSDLLKGKQGRFRQNLLGKRVDYSGRSVIVVGPDLKLNECGLPKKMALELFKPFVMRELVNKGYTTNIKTAKRMVERMRSEVWDVLDEVIHDHPVLLNRAPTLHRLGIQAFMPVLVEGSAIQIHPLVCSAFNADFDGDQMAVHVPLFSGAIAEAKNLMMSSQNVLSAADGHPVVAPTQDVVLGCYWLTAARTERPDEEAARKLPVFGSEEEVNLAYELGRVTLQEWVRVRSSGGMRLTTTGRVIFNQVLPLGLEPMAVDGEPAMAPLEFQDAHFDRKKLRNLIGQLYSLYGNEVTSATVNEVKRLGFKYATKAGITISAMSVPHPAAKAEILEHTEAEVLEVERMYRRGVMTEDERYRKVVELWTRANERVGRATEESFDPFDPIWVMMTSGARGNISNLRQLAGMRGLVADPTNRIIDLPIKANFTEGLTVLEYFISTHGARKGLADTALRTADSGYLTRRLVDVAQDVIVREEDCGTKNGIWVYNVNAESAQNDPVQDRIAGRIVAENVVTSDGEVLVHADEALTDYSAQRAIEANVGSVKVRSVLSCEAREGVCRLCYGRNLATGKLVEIGEAVGVIAAQSIGEPGTQLTMRTFHTGGVAGVDITQGLPRVEELFEARVPKGKAIISEIDGELEILRDEGGRRARVTSREHFEVSYAVEASMDVLVKDGDQVMEGQELARERDGEAVLRTRHAGTVGVSAKEITVRTMDEEVREYAIPHGVRIRPELEGRDGGTATVEAGEQITEGAVNPQDLLQIRGKEAVQTFLVDEVQKVYRSQGVDINDKHIEVIVRQMMRKVRIDQAGDTSLLPGEIVTQWEYEEANKQILAEGGEPATAHTVLLGLIKAALNTTSWLSAASFQETTRVLTEAAISGKIDRLRGLKENVIIGKLIPAGTGLDYYKKQREQAARLSQEEEEPIDLDTLSV